MEQPEIRYKKIVLEAQEPRLATDGSSGYDIRIVRVLDKKTRKVISNLEKPIKIRPGESVLFGSGLALEIPPDHHAAILSRSGLAAKYDIEAGHPGAPIDSDYRGEFTILVRNVANIFWRLLGRKSFKVSKTMKIVQLVVYPRALARWVEVAELSETSRGENGSGSTGLY